MADTMLAARGLTKEFKGFVAVDNVDLNVESGTVHALIGPNGAGKTTCFNLLTKFLQPSAGTITFEGRDISRMAPADIAQLGLPTLFVMEGGYDIDEIGLNTVNVLQGFLGTA